MWHDNEIDMEELEARLYSQVYHSNEEEIPTSKPNVVQEDSTAKSRKRYFEGHGIPQSPYGSQNIHRMYQKHPINKHTYFQAGEDVDLHQPMQYHDSANFYDQIGLFPYPAVNNIVVLPQPPTQIFTQHQSARRGKQKSKKKIKRNERKRRAKEKWTVEQIVKGFKEHRKNTNLENNNDADSNSETLKDEIICLTESDSSDCEIAETHVPSIVVSSDDEGDVKDLHHGDVIAEIKNEANIKSCDIIVEQLESKKLDAETVKVSSSTNNTKNNDVQWQNVRSGVFSEDDDDVVFVEPQTEIVTICDEPQSLTNANTSIASNSTENDAPTLLSKVHTELLDTPESTNDFLDNSFNSSQNNIDVSAQKLSVNDFESDSNFSASDFDAPCKSDVFIEQEFDVPSKDTFSELNLDSFTSYIVSEASTSIPSILIPKRSGSTMLKNNRSKGASLRNSSDSSSESDYDDKVALIQKNRQNLNVDNKTSSSESDDCVVNNDCNTIKNKTLLPNLSPIMSDEETNLKVNRKLNKKKKQKKVSETVVRVSGGGEKRKSIQNIEAVTEIKRIKQNEDNIAKNNDQQEKLQFFSSSDSEVEVVRIVSESPHASVANFDVELLNVGNSSTPIKQLQENSATKPKRFSDYWTEDMEKFYRESWGDENFSVEEEQKAMSDDPNMWKILNRDQIHYKLLPRGPRCYRCRDFGHRANNCNKRIGPPKCILCGASGHLAARCPNKMCTSCGRKSQYSTTYCSRCAHSRHVMCNICLTRGHASSYCTDLWRRYHLTTKDGPLKQPSDNHLIPSNDRWCSGCASRGHFEFNCNYYNRTHTPANPLIRFYEDIYQRREPREQTSNFSEQPQGDSGNYMNPNQVSPWIVGCEPNVYDQQRFSQNFTQNYGSNSNFYQQFPVFQSMPNVFGLQQNLNNTMYPNSANRGNQDIYIPNTGQSTNQASERNLIAKIVSKPNENESQAPLGENKKRDFLKLKDLNMRQLLSRAGLDFLKKLSNNFTVKIQIIKRKKNKKFSYWCMLEGVPVLLSTVKESIKSYCEDVSQPEAEPINVMEVFNGKDFNMQVLQENMSKLNNPNTDWHSMAKKLHQKIKFFEKQLSEPKNAAGQSDEKFRIALKNQYIALNTILLGKTDFFRGRMHMRILNKAAAKGALNKNYEEKLKNSYDYIFKNQHRFNANYNFAILYLLGSRSMKARIDDLFQSGILICKDNQIALRRLKNLYKKVISYNYSQQHVDQFLKLYDRIEFRKQNIISSI